MRPALLLRLRRGAETADKPVANERVGPFQASNDGAWVGLHGQPFNYSVNDTGRLAARRGTAVTQPGMVRDHLFKYWIVWRLGARAKVTEHMRKFVLAMVVIVGPALAAMGQSESSSVPASHKDMAKGQSGPTAAPSREQDVAKAQNGDAHSGTPRNDVIEKGA